MQHVYIVSFENCERVVRPHKCLRICVRMCKCDVFFTLHGHIHISWMERRWMSSAYHWYVAWICSIESITPLSQPLVALRASIIFVYIVDDITCTHTLDTFFFFNTMGAQIRSIHLRSAYFLRILLHSCSILSIIIGIFDSGN